MSPVHEAEREAVEQPRRREGRWALFCRMQIHNPCRRPRWRWDWARDFARLGRKLPKRGLDPLLAIAVQFERTLRNEELPHILSRLASMHFDLLDAHEVYVADGLQRAELEARILARQSDAEIGLLMGLTERAIELYEALFFNVRDRLDAVDWIANFAVRRPSYYGPAEEDIGRAWRAIGYFAGPLVLDAVIEAVKKPKDLTVGLGECDLQTAEDQLAARARLAVAAERLPWSPRLADELVRIRTLVGAFERTGDSCAMRCAADSMSAETLAQGSRGSATAVASVADPIASVEATESRATGEDAGTEVRREVA